MPDRSNKTLEGWKEIAEHFRVSVRTVQQWESERGLPVQRMAGGRSRVWAEVAELDAWREKLAAAPPVVKAARPAWPAIAAGVAVVAAIAIGISAWHAGFEVADAIHDGRQIIAKDAKGRVLWTHRFSNPGPAQFGGPSNSKPVLVDLDGDGRTEVLAHNPTEPDLISDNGVFCFSSTGRILWRFQPGRTVRTAQGSFEPPYQVFKIEPFRSKAGGPWRIGVISVHHLYFPSQVAVLDERGKLLREYWHAGHLHDLAAEDLNRDGKPELYAVGLSNGYRNAVAIALDPEQMEGAGWEESEDYRFQSIQPGVELARWLTPRTPISKRLTKYNLNSRIHRTGDQIMVLGQEYHPLPALALCISFGAWLSVPKWEPCDSFTIGLQEAKARGLASIETVESETRSATGFRDVTSWRQETARSRMTARAPAQ